jgi:hypothetical protein
MQPLERLPDLGYRFGIRSEIRNFAGQQVSALSGFRIRDQTRELIECLRAQLRAVRALIGHIQTRLTGGGEKKQSDEKPYYQERRQRQVPASYLAQLLTQNFHLSARIAELEFNM